MKLRQAKITYIPLDVATALPSDGHWDVWVNRWWTHDPERGLVFYGKSPQCNSHKHIARKVQELHPGTELIFVERVHIRHDCGDYL